MQTAVSLYFTSQSELSTHDNIRKHLEAAGIKTCGPSVKDAGAAILFFREINESVCGRLHEISVNTKNRVLAVSLSSEDSLRDDYWRLLDSGACDVIRWRNDSISASIIAARLNNWEILDELLETPVVKDNLIGRSRIWKNVLRDILSIARIGARSVLIIGESGTGKELVARLMHTIAHPKRTGKFVVLDCTTIVPELSGSEFFGHERGAFTGANLARDGAFALAHHGTLFLDEVAELPLPLQAQLLRVVQEGTYKRLGGNVWNRTDFQLVCATNRDLFRAVQQGEFRHDLYYRVSDWTCRLPPLKERREDILSLVHHFLLELLPGHRGIELDDPVKDFLLQRAYPGNVRELKQVVSRIVYRHVGDGPITVGDVPEEERPHPTPWKGEWVDQGFQESIRKALLLGFGLKEIGRAAQAAAVKIAVEEEDGNLQRASRKLGVTDRALQLRRATGKRFIEPAMSRSQSRNGSG